MLSVTYSVDEILCVCVCVWCILLVYICLCTRIYKYGTVSVLELQVCIWACGNVRPSLYIAVAVGPVGLSHVHAAHRQAHTVDGIAARRHPLVDPVQTFGLLEAADPMLRGEASDGCGDKQAGMHIHTHADTQTHRHAKLTSIRTFSRTMYIQTPGSSEGSRQTEMDWNFKPRFIHLWNMYMQTFAEHPFWFNSPSKCFILPHIDPDSVAFSWRPFWVWIHKVLFHPEGSYIDISQCSSAAWMLS